MIDEIGFVPLHKDAAELLLQVGIDLFGPVGLQNMSVGP